MNKLITRCVAFLALLLCAGAGISSAFAQTGRISMTFAGQVGSEYKLLLMGRQDGTVKLLWGDGTSETKDLYKDKATAIKSKLVDRTLTIEGDVAVLECSGNNLLKLDVAQMPQLTDLISRKNFHTELDLTKSTELRYLLLQDSPVEALDLSHSSQIDSIVCTNNNKLRSLALPQQAPQLKKLDLSTCPFISSVNLKGMPRLEYLDLSGLALTELDISQNLELTYLVAGKSFMGVITQLTLPSPSKLQTVLLPYIGLTTLDLSGSPLLETLMVSYSESLSELNLTGLDKLKLLDCQGCAFTQLDLSGCPNLQELVCNNNSLTELNCSNMARLRDVVCFANQLKKIDLSNCYSLTSLDCSVNPTLETLQLSPSIQTLDVSQCALKEIPGLNQLYRLKSLNCGDNELTELDLSSAYGLEVLSCPKNQIKDLSAVAQLYALTSLNVSGNPITALTVPNAYNIYFIKIDGTALDACALNALYRSLRERRDDDQQNDFGGCMLFNDTPTAPKSKTQIAVQKGWMVSVEGDGSGCSEEGDEAFDVVYTNVAGRLQEDGPIEMWESATSIKIKGELNGSDLRVIRQFCGSDEYAAEVPHERIRKLDLSEARIVPGGVYYIKVDDQGTMREYVVPEGQETLLPDKLFYHCCSIEELVLPKNIREVGIGAFWKCIKLQKLSIPDEVTRINSTAFGVCNALEQITLPRDLEYLGGYAFTYCANLKKVTIPEGVKVLNKRLFDGATSLTKVQLPSQMDSFEPEAFLGAEALQSVTIPNGIKTIPASCFDGCRALLEVTIPADVERIDETAFQDNNLLHTVHFSEGLKTIGLDAFKNCRSLKQLELPNSLQEIAMGAFQECESIASIKFGSGLTLIGEKAFWHCHALKQLELPSSLEQIDYAAFAESMNLEQVNLGAATPLWGQNPFLGCLKLKAFAVSDDNTDFATQDGVLYSKDFTTLYAYPAGRTETALRLHDKTQTVEDFAFWFAPKLAEVTFPEEFAILGNTPFGGCKSLKRLTMLTTTPPQSTYDNDPFEGVDRSQCQLIVPKGSKGDYEQSPIWRGFKIAEDTAIDAIPTDRIELAVDGSFWRLSGIPSSYQIARVVDLTLRTLAEYPLADTTVAIDHTTIPSGSYLIILEDGSTQTRQVLKVCK